jgi:hypothetical protein
MKLFEIDCNVHLLKQWHYISLENLVSKGGKHSDLVTNKKIPARTKYER